MDDRHLDVMDDVFKEPTTKKHLLGVTMRITPNEIIIKSKMKWCILIFTIIEHIDDKEITGLEKQTNFQYMEEMLNKTDDYEKDIYIKLKHENYEQLTFLTFEISKKSDWKTIN